MIRFFLKTFVALLIILSVSWCYGLYCFLTSISHCVIPNDKTDAIVIFTGEKGRIAQGLELLKVYPNTPILVSGVGQDIHSLPLAKKLQKDIVGDITLGHEARDTLGNAQETKKWVQDRGIKSVRLVTSHYHMPRSLLLLQNAVPDVRIISHPIISDNFQSDGWWNNQKVYKMIVAEYNKYLVISIRRFIGL
jgi:uncharacterized SAM-binding protein YcdF (DUF218 family)